jgi:hypothetical protein
MSDPATFLEVYENLRPSFFTGFLTLGSFLLAARNFIIPRAYDHVYNQDLFKTFAASRKAEAESLGLPAAPGILNPLRRLERDLTRTIFGCFGVSFLQVTLGLVPWTSAAVVCYVAALCAIAGAAWLVWQMQRVHLEILDGMEAKIGRDCAGIEADARDRVKAAVNFGAISEPSAPNVLPAAIAPPPASSDHKHDKPSRSRRKP